ncbi:MAG: trypsin-like peptidase domain-containing protein [Pseudomonadota bacterium]
MHFTIQKYRFPIPHVLMLSLILSLTTSLMLCLMSSPCFALSTSDFNAMVKKAEQQRIAVAQMMESGTVFIITEGDGDGIGMGTGFIIAENYVLTNAHVVDGFKRYYVAGKGFAPIKATLIKVAYDGVNGVDDFALLKFNQPKTLPILSFNLSVNRTDKVSAWGYPFLVTQFDKNMDHILEGQYVNLPPVVYTEGVVSSFVEANGGQTIVHSASIAAGNSGGPLINTQGHVLGVNTWTGSIEGDDAFINCAQPAYAAVRFVRSCGIEPIIADSGDAPLLALQEDGPMQSLHTDKGANGAASGAGESSSGGYIPVYLRDKGGLDANSGGGNFPSSAAAAQLTGDAKALYQDALDGDADAQAYVGVSYYMGDEAPELEAEGVTWLMRSAEQNCAAGMSNLGFIYLTNDNFKNVDQGLDLVRRAAAMDHEHASAYAFFLLRGLALGIPYDGPEGYKYAQIAADNGDPMGMALLAYALSYGDGESVPFDEAKALELALAAADAGEPFGHAVAALLLCASDGLEDDFAASLEHAKIAAEAEDSLGMGLVAFHYILETYTDISAKEAAAYAEAAAMQCDEVGQFAMGFFAMDGTLGEPNLPLAWAYFVMSSGGLFTYAHDLLAEVEAELSPQELKQAKSYVHAWHEQWGLEWSE